MLVTFRSNAGGNIIMGGDVAITLLQLMGHSGTVPSAMLAADIPAALARLQQALAAAGADEKNGGGARPGAEDPDAEPPIGLPVRAYPLVQLLSAAVRQGSDVMWEASRATD